MVSVGWGALEYVMAILCDKVVVVSSCSLLVYTPLVIPWEKVSRSSCFLSSTLLVNVYTQIINTAWLCLPLVGSFLWLALVFLAISSHKQLVLCAQCQSLCGLEGHPEKGVWERTWVWHWDIHLISLWEHVSKLFGATCSSQAGSHCGQLGVAGVDVFF